MNFLRVTAVGAMMALASCTSSNGITGKKNDEKNSSETSKPKPTNAPTTKPSTTSTPNYPQQNQPLPPYQYQTTPPLNTTPPPIIRPTPPALTPAPPLPPVDPNAMGDVGSLEFKAIVFNNMEHGKHATDAGSTAILEDNGRVLAFGPVTAAAATNATSLRGEGGAYPASKLKINLVYRDPQMPAQGTAKLSICKINGLLDANVNSSKCIKESTKDSGRPVSWYQVNAPYTVSGDKVTISNKVYGQGDQVVGGLSLNHVMYLGAQGGQVATSDDASSPIVLDLDRDQKISLTDVQYGKRAVKFDVLNLGHTVSTGWVKPNDGLLALDVNQDGKINNGSELFGEASHSVKPIGKFELSPFIDGFDALAQYDVNGDGIIDRNDPIYEKLLVWKDKNSNGVSEKSELQTLEKTGIKSIDLVKTVLGKAHAWPKNNGNEVRIEGHFTWNDNKVGKMYDVWFAQDKNTVAKK